MGWHSLCLTEDGNAWSWGCGFDGRLGHGDDLDQSVPKQIKLKNVSFIKCFAGWGHSALIDSNYNLYTFGESKYGHLCHGDKQNKMKSIKVSNMKVLDASLGSKYIILIKQENDVLGDDEKQNDTIDID